MDRYTHALMMLAVQLPRAVPLLTTLPCCELFKHHDRLKENSSSTDTGLSILLHN